MEGNITTEPSELLQAPYLEKNNENIKFMLC